MQVAFTKLVEQRVSTWTALRGKRTVVRGSTMALGRGDLPHDLVQLVVEATLGVTHGFWGCVEAGGTFRSMRRRRTKPGRAVIALHRDELVAGEHLVNAHADRWRAGRPTPVGPMLDRFDALWNALGDGDTMTVHWPSLRTLEPVHGCDTALGAAHHRA